MGAKLFLLVTFLICIWFWMETSLVPRNSRSLRGSISILKYFSYYNHTIWKRKYKNIPSLYVELKRKRKKVTSSSNTLTHWFICDQPTHAYYFLFYWERNRTFGKRNVRKWAVKFKRILQKMISKLEGLQMLNGEKMDSPQHTQQN